MVLGFETEARYIDVAKRNGINVSHRGGAGERHLDQRPEGNESEGFHRCHLQVSAIVDPEPAEPDGR